MGLLYPFLIPGGLFLAAGVLFISLPAAAALLTPYLALLTLLIFSGGVLAGWRFNRTRIIFALILLLLAMLLFGWLEAPNAAYSLLGAFLPLNLLLILLLPEKGLRSNWTAFYGSLLLAQGFLCLKLLALPQLPDLLTRTDPLDQFLSSPPPFAQLAASGLSLAGALMAIRRQPKPLEAAFFWTILLITLVCYLQPEAQLSQLLLCVSALPLLAGLFESSHSMAYRDDLTGIPGRRAFNEALRRLGHRYSLAMLDIDHFKKFNDQHGHDVGDQVLKMVAAKLATVGGGGQTFRFGGEEFAILFPGKKLDTVLEPLEALREKVATASFIPRSAQRPKQKPKNPQPKERAHKSLSVTISIGVAQPTKTERSPEQVLKTADQALYRAKAQGRNRVCHS